MEYKSLPLFCHSDADLDVHLRRHESNVFKNMCYEKQKYGIMEVRLPGNNVSAVIITPDPIKLIKPQLNIKEGWREREKNECGRVS